MTLSEGAKDESCSRFAVRSEVTTDQKAIGVAHRATATGQLFFTPHGAGAGDVFFNHWIAGIANFSRAGNGDFQRFGNRDFHVPCPCRGDFGNLCL